MLSCLYRSNKQTKLMRVHDTSCITTNIQIINTHPRVASPALDASPVHSLICNNDDIIRNVNLMFFYIII